MNTFYIAAVALTVVALLVLLRPWWQSRLFVRHQASEAEAMSALNAAIYRDQLADLERDRAAGQLTETDYTDGRDELQRRLLADTREDQAATPTPNPTSSNAVWLFLALFIPLSAAGIYALIGKPDAILSVEQQNAKAAASLEKMVEKLARKLEAEPNNPEGWAMLARSYGQMGRFDDAEKSFERIGPALQKDPTLLAAYAELLLEKTNGDFNGQPRQLIAAALALDPEHTQALYLAGADAIQNGRWAEVVNRWTPLLKQLEPESDDANTIAAGLARAKQALERSGGSGGRSDARVGAGRTAAPETSGKTVSGRIELAPALRAKAKPDDVVFIFARTAVENTGGPRMPLAALRLTVADLPYQFTLSDRNALGGAKLSDAGDIRIEARIAKGGTPSPTPGDLTGVSKVVKLGATTSVKGLRVLIDTEAP